MFQKIVLCSDGSEDALAAAKVAADIAQKFDARLLMLTVFNPSFATIPVPGIPPATAYAEAILQYSEEAQAAVEQMTGEVLEKAGVSFEVRREIGHPVDRIVDVAKETHADLIVIGSRGMGAFQRILLGSVSDGVLHHAHCPVLVVRPEEEPEKKA